MANGSKSPYWVGFDLGGTKMLAKVYDADFRELGSERKRTKEHGGSQAGMERIFKTIRKALESSGIDPKRLGGIGVGFPGPVDMDLRATRTIGAGIGEPFVAPCPPIPHSIILI